MSAPSSAMLNNPSPAEYAAAVTKSDSTVLKATRYLYVGTTGNLTVTMAGDGADVVLSNVPAGAILPIRVVKVKAATTASDIVALF